MLDADDDDAKAPGRTIAIRVVPTKDREETHEVGISLRQAQLPKEANCSRCATYASTDRALPGNHWSMLERPAATQVRLINRCSATNTIISHNHQHCHLRQHPHRDHRHHHHYDKEGLHYKRRNQHHDHCVANTIIMDIAVPGQNDKRRPLCVRRATRRHVQATQRTHSIHIDNSRALERLEQGRQADYCLVEPTLQPPSNTSAAAQREHKS